MLLYHPEQTKGGIIRKPPPPPAFGHPLGEGDNYIYSSIVPLIEGVAPRRVLRSIAEGRGRRLHFAAHNM